MACSALDLHLYGVLANSHLFRECIAVLLFGSFIINWEIDQIERLLQDTFDDGSHLKGGTPLALSSLQCRGVVPGGRLSCERSCLAHDEMERAFTCATTVETPYGFPLLSVWATVISTCGWMELIGLEEFETGTRHFSAIVYAHVQWSFHWFKSLRRFH